jgi:hypothetical protein
MLSQIEKKIINEIDIEKAWNHVDYLSTIDKTSATKGEQDAHKYLRLKLNEYSVPYSEFLIDSLISHPISSSFKILEPTPVEVESRPAAFGAMVKEGIEGELVFVDLPEGTLFGGFEGLVDIYKEADIANKITVVWGLAAPTVMLAAERAGAIAQVHIGGEEVIHEMIVTTIWGTPSPNSINRMPRIPALSIRKSDGEKILKTLQKESVYAKITSNVETKWRKIPITVAEIESKGESDKFMLVHGHMDSWFYGTTDNCTGNAACLELARVLNNNRDSLNRAIRIAWWSGHSTGRYSGSTWYADHFFEDLYKNCFVSMNIDSPGVKGASLISGGGLQGAKNIVRQVLRDILSIQVDVHSRNSRAGDQSFYGIGVPSVSIHGRIPKDSPHAGKWIGGSGGAWWWHSPEDTFDKADKNNLHRDMKLEILTILRLVNPKILPFDFTESLDTIEEHIHKLIRENPSVSETLSSTSEKISAVKANYSKLKVQKPKVKMNEILDKSSKILTSILYTYSGEFDQDPAYYMGVLPLLNPVEKLSSVSEDEYKVWMTQIIRNRNKVNLKLDNLNSCFSKLRKITS